MPFPPSLEAFWRVVERLVIVFNRLITSWWLRLFIWLYGNTGNTWAVNIFVTVIEKKWNNVNSATTFYTWSRLRSLVLVLSLNVPCHPPKEQKPKIFFVPFLFWTALVKHTEKMHFFVIVKSAEAKQLRIRISIMTLLDNTITGRTSSSHCGPLSFKFKFIHSLQSCAVCNLKVT